MTPNINTLAYLIGVLVVMNLGTIVSLGVIAFRITWFLAKLESKVDEAKNCAIRVHKRVDVLEREK